MATHQGFPIEKKRGGIIRTPRTSIGLTFRTYRKLFGLTNGIINQDQYTILVLAGHWEPWLVPTMHRLTVVSNHLYEEVGNDIQNTSRQLQPMGSESAFLARRKQSNWPSSRGRTPDDRGRVSVQAQWAR